MTLSTTLLTLLMCLLLLNACLAWLWYSIRTTKVMFEYHLGWGIGGVVSLFLGLHIAVALFFLMDCDVAYEEEVGFFKKLFVSFACVVICIVGLFVVVTNDEKSHSEHADISITESSSMISPSDTPDKTSGESDRFKQADKIAKTINTSAQIHKPDTDVQRQIDRINDMGIKHLKHDPEWLRSKAQIRDYLGENPSSAQINEVLKAIVEEGGRHTPLTLNEHWELMRVSSGYLEYHNYARLTSSAYQLENLDEQTLSQRKKAIVKDNDFCSIFDVFFEHGISLHYHYYNHGNGYVRSVSINADDCP